MSGTDQGRRLASTIGTNIRQAREARGWYQRELAARLGEKTSNQQVSDWERGAVRPNDTTLLRLADVFDKDFAWFFVNHDEPVAA